MANLKDWRAGNELIEPRVSGIGGFENENITYH